MFTDGSALDNGEETATAGAGVFFGEDDARNIAQPLRADEPQTNNRAELTASLLALGACEATIRKGDQIVPIGTDSAYSIMMAGDVGRKARARGWKTSRRKPTKNRDLVELLLQWRAAYGVRFRFYHIYSHTDCNDPLSIGNAGADKLAVRGAKASARARATLAIIEVRGPLPQPPSQEPCSLLLVQASGD